MPEMTLHQIAVSEHDCPAAHQPFAGYTIAELADDCPTCAAKPGNACEDVAGTPLPFFHAPRVAQVSSEGVCLFPHCKCGYYQEELCPEVLGARNGR